jgi:glutamyl-tRNA reductase
MASLVATHLKAKGVGAITVFGRSLERAEALAKKIQGRGRLLTELQTDPQGHLAGVELLFSAVAAPQPVLTASTFSVLAPGSRLVVIDLGVPRNIEEAVENVEGVVLKNVDRLTEVVSKNQSFRLQEAEKASAIVAEEVAKFSQWLSCLDISPTIKDLINLAEEARRLELERTMAKNGFSPEQKEAVETMSRALVRRILHNPLTFAKGCHRHGRSDYRLDVFRRVFGLDPR